MVISLASKLIRRYLLLSMSEHPECRAETASAGPLRFLDGVLVENYTLRLLEHMLRNVISLSYDQSLGTPSEDAYLSEWELRFDARTSLLSPVHLLDKRIIPVGKVHVSVSMFGWTSHTSGGKKKRGY
jgi:hypothetical protein